MKAGSLREAVAIRRKVGVSVPDAGLDPVPVYETVAVVRAEVRSPFTVSGREFGGQLQPVGSYTVTIRGGVDVQTEDEVLWDGLTLQVGSIEHDIRGRWLRLYCSEVKSGT